MFLGFFVWLPQKTEVCFFDAYVLALLNSTILFVFGLPDLMMQTELQIETGLFATDENL